MSGGKLAITGKVVLFDHVWSMLAEQGCCDSFDSNGGECARVRSEWIETLRAHVEVRVDDFIRWRANVGPTAPPFDPARVTEDMPRSSNYVRLPDRSAE